MTKKILIVVAHPDDEILGAGGTLIKQAELGQEINCLILSAGVMARSDGTGAKISALREETQAAGKIIGFKNTYFADLPDNSFDTVSLLNIVKEVEKIIDEIKPDIIYTHYQNDLNIDHRLTFQAVLTACRPININSPRELYSFENPSSTEWQSKAGEQFAPNVYVDITDTIDQKILALAEYVSEIRDYPHPRSSTGLKILAQYRGLEAGLKFAEAFYLIRKVD